MLLNNEPRILQSDRIQDITMLVMTAVRAMRTRMLRARGIMVYKKAKRPLFSVLGSIKTRDFFRSVWRRWRSGKALVEFGV